MDQGWALTLLGSVLVSLESIGMFYWCLEWENIAIIGDLLRWANCPQILISQVHVYFMGAMQENSLQELYLLGGT